MKKLLLTAAAFGLAISATPVSAQESSGPQRMEDVTWARVVLTKFHQGKRERGMEIIKDYFAKADGMTGKNSGIHGVHFDTGEWDAMYVFPMAGGPADMTWVTSPDDIAWMGQLAKLAGGQDQAMKLISEFDSLIARQTSFVGHIHPDH